MTAVPAPGIAYARLDIVTLLAPASRLTTSVKLLLGVNHPHGLAQLLLRFGFASRCRRSELLFCSKINDIWLCYQELSILVFERHWCLIVVTRHTFRTLLVVGFSGSPRKGAGPTTNVTDPSKSIA